MNKKARYRKAKRLDAWIESKLPEIVIALAIIVIAGGALLYGWLR